MSKQVVLEGAGSREPSPAPAAGSTRPIAGDAPPTEPQPAVPSRPALHDQAVSLPRVQVIVVFLTLSFVFFIMTLDTTCVSTALPHMAADLNAGSSITWVGTAFLVASTTTQVIFSRLSDIFGRKVLLLGSIVVFAVGNLLSGFATNAAWLYAGRGVAGLGAGAITSLCHIVISDVVSLRDRGMYLSLMGIPVALGLGLGPIIGGALADHAGWRWSMWISVPVSVAAVPLIMWLLPLQSVPGRMRDKLRTVDWAGCALSLASIVLILVPVSAGGTSWAWDSRESIAMLVIGGVLLLAFLVAEYYHPLPILPLRLFRNRTVSFVLAALMCVGVVWHSTMFITPLYLQNVLGYSAVSAGAIMLPFLVGQVLVMTALGYAMKVWGRARAFILVGYVIWTAGQGMQIAWGEERDLGLFLGTFVLQGVGFGLTSQSTLVLAQAACAPADRAVITGARNLFRSSGGAAGLALSTAILNSVFITHLPSSLSPALADDLRVNGFDRAKVLALPREQSAQVMHAYYLGLRGVFILFTPCIFLCLVLCVGAADVRLDSAPASQPVPSKTSPREELELQHVNGSEPTETTVDSTAEAGIVPPAKEETPTRLLRRSSRRPMSGSGKDEL